MSDLDFDELDRAVNSLIASTPSNDSTAGGSDADPVDLPPVDLDSPLTSPAEPLSTSVSGSGLPTIPVETPVSTVTRPNIGRGMDTARPSDRGNLKMPERAPAPSLQPPALPPLMSQAPPLPVVNQIDDLPATKKELEWPDPIDINPPAMVSTPKDEDADIDQISNDIVNTLNQNRDASAAPDSPFLTDAKVEKRPLGAFSGSVGSSPAVSPISTPMTPSATTAPQATPKPASGGNGNNNHGAVVSNINAPTPLPAELQKDLLSIESDTTMPPAVDKSAPAANSQTTSPNQATFTPQQYTAAAPSGENTNGNIYDTKAYHKAMKQLSKKKSYL